MFTARKRSLGQGNIFSSVCQEFCSQGEGSASVHAWIPPPPPPEADMPPGSRHPPEADPSEADTPPRSRHPLEADTPRKQTPPPPQCMLGDTVNKRAVCILLECNLVNSYHHNLNPQRTASQDVVLKLCF